MSINDTNTSSCEEENEKKFGLGVLIPCGIIIALIIVVAIVGNIFTIVAFVKDKKLHTVYNMYIVNLAITDLLVGCVSMPFYAVYTLMTYTWPFGYHFCKVYMVTDFTLCLEEVIMMIILSLDRLLLLRLGPRYTQKETKNTAYIKIGISWIIAFLVYTPAIIGWDIWTGEDINEPNDCDVQFAYHFEFTLTTSVIEFYIPFLCISILNVIIYLMIRRRIHLKVNASTKSSQPYKQASIALTHASARASTTVDDGYPVPATLQTPQVSKPASSVKDASPKTPDRKDVKAAKKLGLLVAVLAVTWAPYTITTIVISACETCVNEDMHEFMNWLLWTKAALNPFLYAYNSQRFRHNFKSFLSCSKKINRVDIERTASTRA